MEVVRWRPGDHIPPIEDGLIAVDTETERFVDHTYPPVVCLQAYSGEGFAHFVWYDDIDSWLDAVDAAHPHATYAFHNVGFDYGVLGRPDILTRALEQSRVLDTFALDSLRCVKDEGRCRKDRQLAQIARRRLGVEMSKDESVRLTFTRDMELSDAHLEYAMEDARVTYELTRIMDWRDFPTLFMKTRMLVALDDIERRGFLTDEAVRLELLDKFTKKRDAADEALTLWGWRPGVKGNNKVLQQILRGLEVDLGVSLPRTEKSGAIQTTDEALSQLGDCEFMRQHKTRSNANKMISTYLGDKNIGEDGRIRTRFELVSTMRTSSKEPNLQLEVVKFFELLGRLMMRTLQRERKLWARMLEKICIECSFMVYLPYRTFDR